VTKIHNLNQLQTILDKEFSWRLKEIANIKVAIGQQSSLSEKTLVRAGITLLYAHWEGFVKSAAQAYLEFVNTQGHRYEDLTDCFVALGVKKRLRELVDAKKSVRHIAAVDFLRTAMGGRAELRARSAIDTQSNLSSAVFENIAATIGIQTAAYEPRFHLIDESLLARRNKIAHGEYLDLNVDGWRKLADEVVFLMRQVKNDIENSASLSRYLRSGATVGPRTTVSAIGS
jgi:MAE_28990/MAE_18760-like HEPN